jgi:hypothetical protein
MYAFKNGQTSVIVRVKLLDSTSTVGAGKTGLTSSSPGLLIAAATDAEATTTAYAQTAANIQTIATPGTYVAPSAGMCRFAEFDPTNHPGIYEIQLANARYAVAGAKSLIVSWSGATGLSQGDIHIPLQDIDPYSRAGLFQSQMTENYAAVGVAPTPEQAWMLCMQMLTESVITGTTWQINKLNHSTAAASLTLNSSTIPTSVTRST